MVLTTGPARAERKMRYVGWNAIPRDATSGSFFLTQPPSLPLHISRRDLYKSPPWPVPRSVLSLHSVESFSAPCNACFASRCCVSTCFPCWRLCLVDRLTVDRSCEDQPQVFRAHSLPKHARYLSTACLFCLTSVHGFSRLQDSVRCRSSRVQSCVVWWRALCFDFAQGH